MSKKVILFGGIGLVVVGVGVVGFMMFGNGSNTGGVNNSSGPTTGDGQAVEGNLMSLAGGGKAQVCDMSYEGESGTGTGKMYTDGKGSGLMQLELATERS